MAAVAREVWHSLNPLARLQAATQATSNLIEKLGNHGVIIGGVAVGLLSNPRATKDVDAVLLVDPAGIKSLIELAAIEGLTCRTEDPEKFATEFRMILLHHGESNVDVDIAIGALPFEEAMIRNAEEHIFDKSSVRLPRVEDLVVTKAIAGRPQDLADIDRLFSTHQKLDTELILKTVAEFADLLEAPEMFERVKAILSSRD